MDAHDRYEEHAFGDVRPYVRDEFDISVEDIGAFPIEPVQRELNRFLLYTSMWWEGAFSLVTTVIKEMQTTVQTISLHPQRRIRRFNLLRLFR